MSFNLYQKDDGKPFLYCVYYRPHYHHLTSPVVINILKNGSTRWEWLHGQSSFRCQRLFLNVSWRSRVCWRRWRSVRVIWMTCQSGCPAPEPSWSTALRDHLPGYGAKHCVYMHACISASWHLLVKHSSPNCLKLIIHCIYYIQYIIYYITCNTLVCPRLIAV